MSRKLAVFLFQIVYDNISEILNFACLSKIQKIIFGSDVNKNKTISVMATRKIRWYRNG